MTFVVPPYGDDLGRAYRGEKVNFEEFCAARETLPGGAPPGPSDTSETPSGYLPPAVASDFGDRLAREVSKGGDDATDARALRQLTDCADERYLLQGEIGGLFVKCDVSSEDDGTSVGSGQKKSLFATSAQSN